MGRNGTKRLFGYNWLIFTLLAAGVIAMIFPFIWMILSAFKTKADVYVYPPRWLPSEWSWTNFQAVFRMIPFGRYYLNTILTSVAITALTILLSVIAAYSVTKLRYPGKEIFLGFLRSSMFVPTVVTMIPLYLLVGSLKWLDTYQGIILPQVETAFTTMLLMSYFHSIPNELIDSARIDGCGPYRALTRIVIPNSKGPIATATLFTFLGAWRSYTWPLIVTTRTVIRTLPIGMKYLMDESSIEYQIMMAASLMAILPVLIVFVLSEKQLVRSITLTGIK